MPNPQPDTVTYQQAKKLDRLLAAVVADNPFYRNRFAEAGWTAARPPHLSDLPTLPFTTKSDLVQDQRHHPPYGTNLTVPLEQYTRVHQTSGTTGAPLRWLDTAESWEWWCACWAAIYRTAGVTPADRIFVAFSFGPFIGFWAAFDGAQRLGATVIPGGGLSSSERLHDIRAHGATVLVCTPTYALRLAEVAAEEGIDIAGGPVRVTIHAGEPGASLPNVRGRIEAAWGARCVDHVGATEIGAWGVACGTADHVHLLEREFIAEVVDPETGMPASPAGDGARRGELVLTNLGRIGSPVIRYRTGDLVDLHPSPCPCGRDTAYLRGGVLGRVDHMLIVRGVNVFPSAIDNLVRAFPSVVEYQVAVEREGELDELVIRIETADGAAPGVAAELAEHMHRQLRLRPRVVPAPTGTLPRYELKARRFTPHAAR